MNMKPALASSPLCTFATLSPALAADHREAPLIQEDPSADIADIYAFENPNDSNRIVLAMTVNPFSVAAEAITFNFSPDVRYAFHIDNDGEPDASRRHPPRSRRRAIPSSASRTASLGQFPFLGPPFQTP